MATIADVRCGNTMIQIKPDGMLARLEKLIAYHDMPIATITYLVHSLLSEQVAAQGYRVVASGTAADELFTGYYDHYNLQLYELRNYRQFADYLADWHRYIAPVVRNPYLQNPKLYFDDAGFRRHIYLNNDIFAGYLRQDFAEQFHEELFCDCLLRNRMLNELFHEAIPVILHEDDLNSMLYSIENRSPYLDSNLFDFAYSIPPEHLICNGYNKYPLREAVKGILNEQVRSDRQKKGFNAAIHSLVDFDDPRTREYLLDDSVVFTMVNRDKIAAAVEMQPLPNSFSKFLFNFINIKIFLEMNATCSSKPYGEVIKLS